MLTSSSEIVSAFNTIGTQLSQLRAQQPPEQGVQLRGAFLGQPAVGIAELLLKARVGLAAREIQVAEDALQRHGRVKILETLVQRTQPLEENLLHPHRNENRPRPLYQRQADTSSAGNSRSMYIII